MLIKTLCMVMMICNVQETDCTEWHKQMVMAYSGCKNYGPVANSGVGRTMGCTDLSFTLC